MQRNAIWIAFLLIVVTFTMWFVVKAGWELVYYYQLRVEVPIKVEKWGVVEHKTNQYAVEATFSYKYRGKNYQANGYIGDFYPNPWAAQRHLKGFEEKKWHAWIRLAAPEKAVLNKKFPYRATLSAAVLVGLVVYFLCLGLYVGKRPNST